ncbi:hypothetical protein [Salinibacter grassmerensis]|uniref:hypothetical protein n=1 Tax=Salinibacter grassmerensis TaxID=3040353 RepID=UPI0021E88A03|nr:hypothetical protein [Salinibacter grassmerensis]
MDMVATATGSTLTLPRALRVATGPSPTQRATRRVVHRCHQIARVTLRQQKRTGSLREDVLGEDVEDLAMDAIAGLFERDDRGRFSELRRYFEGQVSPDHSEEKLIRDLRRLVQSTVTDWLFEAYRAADRSLSNQIRSLKRAVRQREDLCLRRRGTVQWIEFEGQREPSQGNGGIGREDRRPGRPMPLEALEAHLTGEVAEASSTGDLLEKAIETLWTHPEFEAAYPLTRLAQVMRAARTRVQSVTEHSGSVSHPDQPILRPEETRRYIQNTLSSLRAEKRPTYVGQGKVDEPTYEAYFAALRDRLEARFVPPGDPEMTHHEALMEHLPGLTKETYRDQHRARFEYLEQKARETLVSRLQDVIQ